MAQVCPALTQPRKSALVLNVNRSAGNAYSVRSCCARARAIGAVVSVVSETNSVNRPPFGPGKAATDAWSVACITMGAEYEYQAFRTLPAAGGSGLNRKNCPTEFCWTLHPEEGAAVPGVTLVTAWETPPTFSVGVPLTVYRSGHACWVPSASQVSVGAPD